MQYFRAFDEHTSLEEKNKTYATIHKETRKRIWYKDKSNEEYFDSKCYFHYHPKIKKINALPQNNYYQDFIKNMDIIFKEVFHITQKILLSLENKWILKVSDFIWEDDSNNHLLRILNYKPTPQCITLAKPHTDRWFMTLTVYETHLWLEFVYKGNTVPIQYTENITNIFPGDYWTDNTNIPIPATVHQVTKMSDNTERSAIVFFVNQLHT